MIEIRFTLNGESASATVPPAKPASKVLRESLGLTGTKPGCGEGGCGACTILLDGEAVNSCLLPAALLDGREVVTIEGLESPDGSLHPVQRAFVEAGAVQCGFCTPGIAVRAAHLINRDLTGDRTRVERGLAGHLCRCTGYSRIVDAISVDFGNNVSGINQRPCLRVGFNR